MLLAGVLARPLLRGIARLFEKEFDGCEMTETGNEMENWKMVPPARFTGPVPSANGSDASTEAARYVVQLQSGGLARTLFVDISSARSHQWRKMILEYSPGATEEVISREMCQLAENRVQQHLAAGNPVPLNEVLNLE